MRKPWNLPNLPVYSIMTQNEGRINMNICTYVTAISMEPKRYAIGIYYNTQTLINIQGGSAIVLQLLSESQFPLVRNFGQKSGINWDKDAFIMRKNSGNISIPNKVQYELIKWKNVQVLKHAAAWIELKPLYSQEAGDHELFLFDVISYKTNSESILTLNTLRERNIIRA